MQLVKPTVESAEARIVAAIRTDIANLRRDWQEGFKDIRQDRDVNHRIDLQDRDMNHRIDLLDQHFTDLSKAREVKFPEPSESSES
jgi:hypothetical protein